MDARGIAKVSRVVPGPKLSIGLFASARFPFCWMKVDLARRMKNSKDRRARRVNISNKRKPDRERERNILFIQNVILII